MLNLKKKLMRISGLVPNLGAKTLLMGSVLLVCASTAHAVPQLMTDYGDQVGWVSAESNAMGATGASVYRGGLSNIFNPAYLAMEKELL